MFYPKQNVKRHSYNPLITAHERSVEVSNRIEYHGKVSNTITSNLNTNHAEWVFFIWLEWISSNASFNVGYKKTNPARIRRLGVTQRLFNINSGSVRIAIAPAFIIHSVAGIPNFTPIVCLSRRISSLFETGLGEPQMKTPLKSFLDSIKRTILYRSSI